MKPDIIAEKLADEAVARTLNIIRTVFSYQEMKWFMSFGALLYFIRDKNMGVKFETDFDVSVLSDVDHKLLIQLMEQWSYKVVAKTVHSETRKPFQLVFKSSTLPYSIDVFFWKKYNDYWWHTYDYYGERSKNGIPKKYVFKGTPKWAMKGDIWRYSWEEIAGEVNFPHLYGTLLDIWYPGWFVTDKNFGQSHGKIVKLKNCKHLERELK